MSLISPRSTMRFRLVSWLFLVAPLARGEETRPLVKSWRAGALVGFAREFTTGVSHWGMGFGGFAGTHAGHFYFDGRLQLHLGEESSAKNSSLVYLARYQSVTAQLSATYDFGIAGGLSFRPGLALGGTLLFGGTTLGLERRNDARILFGVGPELQFVWTGSTMMVGLHAQALFVPSRVAAPVLGMYLTVGTRF